ncbi:hypothetical protein DV738_g5405, partial [Chaetothyriales sp. CBS 135597]
MASGGWFQRLYWTVAGLGLAYVLGLAALTHSTVQRNATYLHNANPAVWQDLSDVESFGFLPGQVTPFTVKTVDNETIFAWHILPAHVYKEHRDELVQQVNNSPLPATLIVSFHGNAGHLASAFRPGQYQNLLGLSTPSRPVHVIAFDYRGFGLSTGSPSEEGVTLDAIALLSQITGHTLPTSIVDLTNPVLQSSLGTFVSTSFYHAWTLQLRRPPFKGLVLLASFSSLTKLLDSYSIKGLTPPLLSPLAVYPPALAWLHRQIVDKWDTATRLSELVTAKDLPLDLTIMHATDDVEIPWPEGWENWRRCGHNKIAIGEGVKVALLRLLDY